VSLPKLIVIPVPEGRDAKFFRLVVQEALCAYRAVVAESLAESVRLVDLEAMERDDYTEGDYYADGYNAALRRIAGEDGE